MSVLILHGATGFLDEFIELGLPLLVFGGLYWWSTRKEKIRKRAAAAEQKKDRTDGPAGTER